MCESLFLKDVIGSSQFSVKANSASIYMLYVVLLQHSKTRAMKLMLKGTMKLL